MKPNILFVYDHRQPEYWIDGLYMALQSLESDFSVTKVNLYDLPTHTLADYDFENNMPDFVLGWGGFRSSVDIELQKLGLKKGLCIAGNAFPPDGANNYDVLFYETKWYRPQIAFHKNIVQAFGVNTDIYFKADLLSPIVWDYIGVGSFASWKRWERMAQKDGTRLIVGEYQIDNATESESIILPLLRSGVMISGMVSPFDLSNLYNWSRKLYIPADINGGGERAILEARSCGLKVEIEDDNPKLKEIVEWDPIPDHLWYASQLKKGILSVL